jgi:CheY-like chemotaxis protein
MKKSLTQMTKTELIEQIKQRDQLIAQLNSRIDELEIMFITSSATPLDASASRLLASLSLRIKSLEEKLKNVSE